MVNTRQFSGSTYMQDMTKSHTFSAKNQGSTYTPIRLIRREIRYKETVDKPMSHLQFRLQLSEELISRFCARKKAG